MSGFVDAVSADIPDECQAQRCRAAGCTLKLDGLIPARVLIAMDCGALKLSQADGRKKCDFVFVGNGNWVVPIELKRGGVDANEVAGQLQAGADFAQERIVPQTPTGDVVRFRPVVASGAIHPRERDALRRKRIRFQDARYEILRVRCGSSLVEVIPNANRTTRPIVPGAPRRRRRGRDAPFNGEGR